MGMRGASEPAESVFEWLDFGPIEVVDSDGFDDHDLREAVLDDALYAELHGDHAHGATVAVAGELQAQAAFIRKPLDEVQFTAVRLDVGTHLVEAAVEFFDEGFVVGDAGGHCGIRVSRGIEANARSPR